jgi:hypothetical protein
MGKTLAPRPRTQTRPYTRAARIPDETVHNTLRKRRPAEPVDCWLCVKSSDVCDLGVSLADGEILCIVSLEHISVSKTLFLLRSARDRSSDYRSPKKT